MEDPLNHTELSYKIDVRRDLVIVRMVAALPFAVDEVTKLLVDLDARRNWDVMFHRGKRIATLDANTDIVHMVFKSTSSPYKFRDFCLLRSWGMLDGCTGGRILATRSVLHDRVPEQKENVRAVLFASGYIITPLDERRPEAGSLFTFVSQMDRESVLIVSPDLLGETNLLRDSVRLMRQLLGDLR